MSDICRGKNQNSVRSPRNPQNPFLTTKQFNTIKDAIVSKNPAHIWIINKNYQIVYMNELFKNYIHDHAQTLLALGDNIFHLPLDEGTIYNWKDYYNTAFSGKPLSIDSKLKFKSGTHYISCQLNPLHSTKDNTVWGVIAFGMDNSVRGNFKEKLLKYRALYNQAEKLLGIGSAEWNIKKGEIIPYDNWLTIHGVSKEKLTFADLMQLAHPEDVEKIKTALDQAFSGTKPYNLEHRIVRGNDGEIRIVKALAEVLRSANGDPIKVYGVVQDITDIRSMYENYNENLEKYKNLFELISDAIFLIDNETGDILEANDAATTMYGYSHEELLTLNNSSLSAEPKKTKEAMAKKLTNISVRYHRKKDGTIFPVEITASHYQFNGKPVHIAAIRDISDRKEAEIEIEKIRNLLNETQRISKVGGWEIDIESGEIRWTDEVYKIYGVDPETYKPDGIEQNIQFYSDVSLKSLKDAFYRALHQGEPYDLELKFKRAGDQLIWVRMIGKPQMENGKVKRIQGIIMDITAMKNAEELYTSILESIPIAVLGLNNRMIVFANRDVETVFGWKPKEIIGKSTRILYRDDDVFRHIGESVYGHLKHHTTYTSDLKDFCRHKDGREILCRIKAAVVGDQPGGDKIVATYEDVTDLVKTKERLGQTHEDLKNALSGAIKAISSMVEAKDPYTFGHQERVRQLATAIGRELCLSEETLNNIEIASILHDVGKIQVPADLLVKPSALTEIEFSLIKEHAEVGYKIVKDISLPENVAEAIYQHHEKLNGSGYPRSLMDDQIIIEARIICVADVVEAMASHRPYRPALGIDFALREINKHKNTLYDPSVVDACIDLFEVQGFTWEPTLTQASIN